MLPVLGSGMTQLIVFRAIQDLGAGVKKQLADIPVRAARSLRSSEMRNVPISTVIAD